jgi:hypothetical protein
MEIISTAPHRPAMFTVLHARRAAAHMWSHVVSNLGIISFGIFSYTLHIKFIENLPTATNEKKKKYKINM